MLQSALEALGLGHLINQHQEQKLVIAVYGPGDGGFDDCYYRRPALNYFEATTDENGSTGCLSPSTQTVGSQAVAPYSSPPVDFGCL